MGFSYNTNHLVVWKMIEIEFKIKKELKRLKLIK